MHGNLSEDDSVMPAMEQLERALAEHAEGYGTPLLARLFGTSDAHAIASRVGEFVATALSPIARIRFVHVGVGLVVGAELDDDRAVVTKFHRSTASLHHMTEVQRVQETLADRGVPAPRPLAAPTSLHNGIATIEELRPGERPDGHAADIRRALATGLAEFIEDGATIDSLPEIGRGLLEPTSPTLWPEPHDLRFDFDRTAAGAEWIDDLARAARTTLAKEDFPDVVAHLDWRVENLGFEGTDLVAIYDWDSIGLAPEPVVVGQAAAVFSTDWRIGHATLPSVAEMRLFVADYEAARGRPFSATDRQVLDAGNLMLCAYSARCEHSDQRLYPELASPAERGWQSLLRARGTSALY